MVNYLWTLYGEVAFWPGSLARVLRGRCDPEYGSEVEGKANGGMLGALGHTEHGRVGVLLAELVAAHRLAIRHGGRVKLDVLIASLEDSRRGGVLPASEPIDDEPVWRPLAPQSLVSAADEGGSIAPTDDEGGGARLTAPGSWAVAKFA